jgi:hypothetical protein
VAIAYGLAKMGSEKNFSHPNPAVVARYIGSVAGFLFEGKGKKDLSLSEQEMLLVTFDGASLLCAAQ